MSLTNEVVDVFLHAISHGEPEIPHKSLQQKHGLFSFHKLANVR